MVSALLVADGATSREVGQGVVRLVVVKMVNVERCPRYLAAAPTTGKRPISMRGVVDGPMFVDPASLPIRG